MIPGIRRSADGSACARSAGLEPMTADPLSGVLTDERGPVPWQTVGSPNVPTDGTVTVYAFDLDHPSARIAGFAALLSPDEAARAGRFIHVTDRNRFIAGRAGLRLALGSILQADPAGIRFEYGHSGKPALATGNLHFNLAHSKERALLAVTRAAEVGVDIEAVVSLEFDDIADRFFSPDECAEYRLFTPERRPEAFFRCWTRKEAIIKAVGDGLSLPLDAFDVSIAADSPSLLRLLDHDRPADWSLLHLEPGAGFAGAVAVRFSGADLECRRWDIDRAMRGR